MFCTKFLVLKRTIGNGKIEVVLMHFQVKKIATEQVEINFLLFDTRASRLRMGLLKRR